MLSFSPSVCFASSMVHVLISPMHVILSVLGTRFLPFSDSRIPSRRLSIPTLARTYLLDWQSSLIHPTQTKTLSLSIFYFYALIIVRDSLVPVKFTGQQNVLFTFFLLWS
jgi:hypothetical protein